MVKNKNKNCTGYREGVVSHLCHAEGLGVTPYPLVLSGVGELCFLFFFITFFTPILLYGSYYYKFISRAQSSVLKRTTLKS